MKIKVITVDFWNTIFDSSNGSLRNAYRQRALIEEMDKYGILIKQEEFSVALKASWEYFDGIWKNDMRTPTPYETVDFFWKYLNLPYYEDSIRHISMKFADSILHHPPALISGVRDALHRLEYKYMLAIISDTGFSPGATLRQLLDKFEIRHYFKAFSFSDETGVSKPHEKAFLHILEELDCPPENALHIGDIEKTDIMGAKRLGMNAIRFKGDPTVVMDVGNSHSTEADAEAESWEEVLEIIESLQSAVASRQPFVNVELRMRN